MAALRAPAATLLVLLALAAAGGVAADGSDHRYKIREPVPLYANKVGPFHNPRWGLTLQIPVVTNGSWVLGRDRIRLVREMCGLFLPDLMGECSCGFCATSVNADRFIDLVDKTGNCNRERVGLQLIQ
jgi:hypothetical protein